MRVSRQSQRVVITFSRAEGHSLAGALRAVAADYEVAPEQLDPAVREAFYSTRGCASSGMSGEETSEWVGQLHEFKSDRLKLMKQWIPEFAAAREGLGRISLTVEEATTLMAILNDHRLSLAATFQLGEMEMNLGLFQLSAQLPPAHRAALFQIEIFGHVIHKILEAVAPDAAGWME